MLILAGGGLPRPARPAAPGPLDRVLAARPDLADGLAALLTEVAGRDPAAVVAELRGEDPMQFFLLAVAVPGAYFLDPEIRASFGYHGQEAVPIDPDAPPDYAEDGLLDEVVARARSTATPASRWAARSGRRSGRRPDLERVGQELEERQLGGADQGRVGAEGRGPQPHRVAGGGQAHAAQPAPDLRRGGEVDVPQGLAEDHDLRAEDVDQVGDAEAEPVPDPAQRLGAGVAAPGVDRGLDAGPAGRPRQRLLPDLGDPAAARAARRPASG